MIFITTPREPLPTKKMIFKGFSTQKERFYPSMAKKKITPILFTTAVVLLATEAIVRLFGFTPHAPSSTKLVAEPPGALSAHPQYGLALKPGTYKVTINEGLKYRATHLPDRSRLTLPVSDTSLQKEIAFYGCSFTYGMGVDDEETFPALVQQALPKYQTKNYSCPAWSSLHALLVMKKQFEKGVRPDVAVLGYTSLQDARNQLSGIQQKYWREAMFGNAPEAAQKANFPYAFFEKAQLNVEYKPFLEFSQRWWLSRYSAAVFRLENAISNILFGFTDKYELTEAIIRKIDTLCRENYIRFIVVALDKGDSTEKLEGFCKKAQIEFVDATLDISDQQFNLQPYDSHPNQKAHRSYAKRIVAYLKG
jgi:hypothetical protein